MAEDVKDAVLAAVDPDRVLKLEQGCVRIPSPTFQEAQVADYFADYMRSIGLEVTVYEVEDPFGSGKRSRQPVGRLRGTGGGKSLMLNGHMDHNPVVGSWDRDPFSGDFDGEYIYGRGSQDDKGGIVSAISAAEAFIKSGVRLKGDLVICPVMGHKSGAIGSSDLIRRGVITDYCINTENSGNGLAITTVGAIKVRLHAGAPMVHIIQGRPLPAVSRFDQLSRIIAALGPSLRKIPRGGWLTYEECAELPDYPQLNIDNIVSTYFEEHATVEFHLRTVPGITVETLRADLERVVAAQGDGFRVEMEIPPKDGQYAAWDWMPVSTSPSDPLAVAVIEGHKRVTGKEPVVGAGPRLGAVGDASMLQKAGIRCVLYGPGDIDLFPQWPTPDERVTLDELLVAAKVYALAAIDICGVA